MVQSALFFILGVLVTVFVAALVAPSIWRRGLLLSRRQVEAELPISLAEIRSDRDGLRAQHAVEVAKISQKLNSAREKTAQQSVSLGRQYEELKQIPILQAELEQMTEKLAANNEVTAKALEDRNVAAEKADILSAKVEQLERNNTALENLVNTFRIEVGGYEAQKVRQLNEISELRRDRKDSNSKYQGLYTQLTNIQTELKNEKRRNGELEEKQQRLITQLSDAQEKLERLSRNPAVAANRSQNIDTSASKEEMQILRDELSQIAAQLVSATIDKEGDNSPILKILGKDSTNSDGAKPKRKRKSLAARVRELHSGS